MAYEISIDAPTSESTVTSPFTVSGTAYLVEDVPFNVRDIPTPYKVVVEITGSAPAEFPFAANVTDWSAGPFAKPAGDYDITAYLHVTNPPPGAPDDSASVTSVHVTGGEEPIDIEPIEEIPPLNADAEGKYLIKGKYKDRLAADEFIYCTILQRPKKPANKHGADPLTYHIKSTAVNTAAKRWEVPFTSIRKASFTVVAFIINTSSGKIIHRASRKHTI